MSTRRGKSRWHTLQLLTSPGRGSRCLLWGRRRHSRLLLALAGYTRRCSLPRVLHAKLHHKGSSLSSTPPDVSYLSYPACLFYPTVLSTASSSLLAVFSTRLNFQLFLASALEVPHEYHLFLPCQSTNPPLGDDASCPIHPRLPQTALPTTDTPASPEGPIPGLAAARGRFWHLTPGGGSSTRAAHDTVPDR